MAQQGSGGISSRSPHDWRFIQASENLVEALHAYVVALHLERGQARSALTLTEKLCAVGEDVCLEVSDLMIWRDLLEEEPVPLPPARSRPALRLVHSAD